MTDFKKTKPFFNDLIGKKLSQFQNFEHNVEYFEGNPKLYPYLDTVGYITTCKGKNVDNQDTFLNTNWLYDNRPAKLSEKKIAFNTLKSLPYGSNYNANSFKNKTNLTLPEEYCNQAYKQDLDKHYKQLQNSIPNFNRMPFPTKLAMLETHYNTGSLTNENKWPNLHKYAREYNQSLLCKNLKRSVFDKNGNKIANMPQRNDWAYEYCMLEPFE